MTDRNDELDLLFAQARNERPALPDELAVRIEMDAEAVRLARLRPAPQPQRSLWRRIVAGIGGWRSVGGLVAAGAAGVWIGFSAPMILPDPANYLFPQETEYVFADLSLDADYLEETE